MLVYVRITPICKGGRASISALGFAFLAAALVSLIAIVVVLPWLGESPRRVDPRGELGDTDASRSASNGLASAPFDQSRQMVEEVVPSSDLGVAGEVLSIRVSPAGGAMSGRPPRVNAKFVHRLASGRYQNHAASGLADESGLAVLAVPNAVGERAFVLVWAEVGELVSNVKSVDPRTPMTEVRLTLHHSSKLRVLCEPQPELDYAVRIRSDRFPDSWVYYDEVASGGSARQFELLAAGAYRVEVVLDGDLTSSGEVYLNLPWGADMEVIVPVNIGSRVTVQGRVVNESGVGVADVPVSFHRGGEWVDEVLTNDQGGFRAEFGDPWPLMCFVSGFEGVYGPEFVPLGNRGGEVLFSRSHTPEDATDYVLEFVDDSSRPIPTGVLFLYYQHVATDPFLDCAEVPIVRGLAEFVVSHPAKLMLFARVPGYRSFSGSFAEVSKGLSGGDGHGAIRLESGFEEVIVCVGNGKPVAGAVVHEEGVVLAISDEEGVAVLKNRYWPKVLTIVADGYHDFQLHPEEQLLSSPAPLRAYLVAKR